MDYHVFRKAVKSGKKTTKRWYYWYYDDTTCRQIQKVCRGCSTKWDAEQFVQKLPPLTGSSTLLKDIARDMYIPGSKHCLRRQQMGMSVELDLLMDSKRYLNYILQDFGETSIYKLTVQQVMDRLWAVEKSSSWKNSYLKVLKEIYTEASWQGISVTPPLFQRIKNNYRKSDVLTREELEQVMQPENFKNETVFLFFLLTVSAGLRLSETRALKPDQIYADKSMVLINGFLDKQNKIKKAYCKKGSADDPRWRIAIVPTEVIYLLQEYISKNQIKSDDYLFQFNGLPFRMEYAEDLLQSAYKKSGISMSGRKLTVHSLRYTYVTIMREQLDVDVVRKMVGHTTVEMTNYYTRPGLESAARSLAPFVAVANQAFKN